MKFQNLMLNMLTFSLSADILLAGHESVKFLRKCEISWRLLSLLVVQVVTSFAEMPSRLEPCQASQSSERIIS